MSPVSDAPSLRDSSPPQTIRYADVALPLGVDKTFTYLVPPELQPFAVAGARAIVPFGRRYLTGMIVSTPPVATIPGLKPIRDIIDPSPLLPPELLRLCSWIAEYYFAPPGEVLKSALPLSFTGTSRRNVRLARRLTAGEIALAAGRSRARAKLLSLLQKEGALNSVELQKKVGTRNIHALLNDLENASLIETEEILPHSARRTTTRDHVLLSDLDPAEVQRTMESLPARKKKAHQLLRTLLLLRKEGLQDIPVRDLLRRSGATTSTLREFRSVGLVPVAARAVIPAQDYGIEEQTRSIVLNPAQQKALTSITTWIDREAHRTLLLHGITGSGKTQVYIEAIRHCLTRGKTAIVLVPEISLTPQMVRRFKTHFGEEVAVVHSRMAGGERYQVWRLAMTGRYSIVIGPRSAVFAPLQNLGLIVVDEEHEASYKQYDAVPRYHARDVAIVRGNISGSVVLLGSATPSVESYSNATSGKYDLLQLPHRVDEVPLPPISIVDMTGERRTEYAALKARLPVEGRAKLREFQQSSLSALLREKIHNRLGRKEGIILLQNRRGFAPFVECIECGFVEQCEHCSITLTYHLARKHLRCHYCGVVRQPHILCPDCGGSSLHLRGVGTQRVEQELMALFPSARIQRMDLDTTSRRGAHDRILRKFGAGETDILLGTQMVAKGLDFAHVTLVGVISADTQMLLPDFRSSERTFQLLTQVAGRAGRSTLKGEVVIQTHQPEHFTLLHVVDHDFRSFYEQELLAREELDYPPFSRLLLVEMRGTREEQVRQESERFGRMIRQRNGTFTVLGPSPAVIAKISNRYRWHILLKSVKSADPAGSLMRAIVRAAMEEFSRKVRHSVQVTVDVDPVGLL